MSERPGVVTYPVIEEFRQGAQGLASKHEIVNVIVDCLVEANIDLRGITLEETKALMVEALSGAFQPIPVHFQTAVSS